MKHKVGDIVKVRKDLKAGNDNGELFVTSDMAELAGKLVTIFEINGNYYRIVENDFLWTDDFFEDKDEEEKEEKSDEYEDIIDEVLSGMSEETKDILIKEIIKGENCITIVAVPVYETVCRRNGISIQQIVGTKYSVTVISKDGTVVL